MVEATLSSKNQIVIPREIREALQLEPGDKFIVHIREKILIFEPKARHRAKPRTQKPTKKNQMESSLGLARQKSHATCRRWFSQTTLENPLPPHPPHSASPPYTCSPAQSPSSPQPARPQSPPAHLQSLHTRPRRIPIPPHPSNTAPDAAF